MDAIHDTDISEAIQSWRPIHYLGSKLRMVEPINSALKRAGANEGRLLDLFSGSGTVFLSQISRRPVTALDIQEYSRVICSALSYKGERSSEFVLQNADEALQESSKRGLLWAVSPLVEYEETCIEIAAGGNLEPLCRFLEAGSPILADELPSTGLSKDHSMALGEFKRRLGSLQPGLTLDAAITQQFGGLYFP